MTDTPEAQGPNPVGRPSLFTQELCDEICSRLTEGESLRNICQSKGMPSAGTVCRWLGESDKAAFREQYARAREAQADYIFDEILDIADNGANDWMERNYGDDTRWVENGEAIRRSQIRIDARKWAAGKMKPKVYGEKSEINIGGQPGNPVLATVAVTIVDPDPKA